MVKVHPIKLYEIIGGGSGGWGRGIAVLFLYSL
jgi:hypothetical protein